MCPGRSAISARFFSRGRDALPVVRSRQNEVRTLGAVESNHDAQDEAPPTPEEIAEARRMWAKADAVHKDSPVNRPERHEKLTA